MVAVGGVARVVAVGGVGRGVVVVDEVVGAGVVGLRQHKKLKFMGSQRTLST